MQFLSVFIQNGVKRDPRAEQCKSVKVMPESIRASI